MFSNNIIVRSILVIALVFCYDVAGETISGECGYKAKFALDTTYGSLTISGEGSLYDYSYLPNIPWYKYSDIIKSVVVKHGITRLGDRVFRGLVNLTSVSLADSVSFFGTEVFRSCKSLKTVRIPSSVQDLGSHAFFECASLSSISIPSSITNISYATFGYCSSLTTVRIPNSVTNIDVAAFSDCTNLTYMKIPDSVKSIDNLAFSNCEALKTVILGKGLNRIGAEAFRGCGMLNTMTIPEGVTQIGQGAFSFCDNLNSVFVEERNTVYKSEDGIMFNKAGDCLVLFPAGKKEKFYSVPETVKTIGYWAFASCLDLESVTMPDSVVDIGREAFYSSGLKTLTIPKYARVEFDAFNGCLSLTKVTIPGTVVSLGQSAFYNCAKLNSVNFLGSKEPVHESDVFGNCKALKEVQVPRNYKGDTFCDVPVKRC